MKYIYMFFGFICVIGFGLYFLLIYQKGTEYPSPNGEFIIIVKKESRFFHTTMPGTGGTGSIPVIVTLKDKSGKLIGKSSDNLACLIFDGSIYIKWDLKKNIVWYGKGKYINLITGKVEC